jgi:hypothetical protein
VILLVGLDRPVSGDAVLVVSGSFGGPNPFKVDPGFVSTYKNSIAQIAGGSLASRSLYLPGELSVPDEDPYEDGNSSYHVSVFDGLAQGDIVRTAEVLQFRYASSDPWEDFGGGTQSVLIGNYTHSSTQTVSNFRDFIEDAGGGAFRFTKGTGLFWYVLPQDDIVGWELRVIRDYEVIRGGSLLNPTVNGRGLTVGTGVDGGQAILAGRFVGTAVAVPEPGSIALASIGAAAIGAAGAIRRRRM